MSKDGGWTKSSIPYKATQERDRAWARAVAYARGRSIVAAGGAAAAKHGTPSLRLAHRTRGWGELAKHRRGQGWTNLVADGNVRRI